MIYNRSMKNRGRSFKKIFGRSMIFTFIAIFAFSNFVSMLPQSWQNNKFAENFKVNEALAAVIWQAVGLQVNSTGAAVSPVWPSHLANDIGIMIVETGGDGTTTTANGWTHITGSPVVDVATTAGSKLNILWRRAATNAEATVATNTGVDHQIAQIYTFRGAIETGNPWDVIATGIKTAASVTATAPSVTTTVANTLVLLIVGRPDDTVSTTHFGAFTNAGLGTITERGEAGSNNGHGGGFVLTTGTRAVAGATGTSASTKAVSTTDTYMTLALIPSLATVATLGTQTANMNIGATNQYVGGQFMISTTGNTNITAITVTESGTVDALANLNNIKLYSENDVTSPYDCASETLSSPSSPTEAQFGVTDTNGFSAANGTSAFTGSVAITPIATQCVYVVLDVGTGVTANQTIEISINASTDVTSSVANIGGTFPVAIAGGTTINVTPVTTIGNGTNSSSVTIAPSATVTDLNSFSVQTNSGTDAVTGLTVTLSAGTAESISLVEITTTGDADVCTDVANPGTATVAFTGCTISGSTTLTEYKVRITPKTHVNMPAPPGLSYAVTGTVTSVTSTNTKTYSDSGSATVTVDNLSPAGATATSGTSGDTSNTINWTTSSSADFNTTSGSVVLRWASASAGAQVPAEGSVYTAGNTIGTATVACVVSSAVSTALSRIDGIGGGAGCTTAALISGQAYTYRVFQRDTNGNYDVGVSIGTFTTILTTTTTIGNGTNPSSVTIAPSATVTDLNRFSVQTSGGTDSITGLTVTLASGTAESISLIQITTTGDANVCTSVANPSTTAVAFTGCDISGSTTLTEYKVRITPKTHVNMPVPPGLSYAVTGTVTSVTSTNTKTYSDSGSATVTVDNLSPGNVTVPSVSNAIDGQVTISYTTPADVDLGSMIVLRNTVAITGTPTEGFAYTAGGSVGSDTVACVDPSVSASAADSCVTTGLINGTAYFFKIFVMDTRGNYSQSGIVTSPTSITPNSSAGSTSTNFELHVGDMESITGPSTSATFRLHSAGGQTATGIFMGTIRSIYSGILYWLYGLFASVLYDQVHFRWREDNGDELTATWPVNEDGLYNGFPKNTIKRLRIEMANNSGLTRGAAPSFMLEVAQTDTCATCSYIAVPNTYGAGAWVIATTSPYITVNVVTTNVGTPPATGLTDVGDTFVPGMIQMSSNNTGPITLNAGSFTELEYVLIATSNATNENPYCFRLTNNGSTADFRYSNYARANLTSGLPATGTLDSAVFDTFTTNSAGQGPAYNSIMWKGQNNGFGKVQFQLATSDCPNGATNFSGCSTGTWSFIGGATCNGDGYYDTTGTDKPVELSCSPAYHNNQRYFRYRVRLCSKDCFEGGEISPIVNDVVVNWAP